MTPIQVWVEGYKARGEACKQGGIVASILIAGVATSLKGGGDRPTAIVAIVMFSLAVGCSALAFLFVGYALTAAAEAASGDKAMDVAAAMSKKKGFFMFGNVFGVMEIVFLLVGLVPAVVAMSR